MTDTNNTKRLRKLAEQALLGGPFNGSISQYLSAANPQAIIEVLDMADRYRNQFHFPI